MAAAVRVCMLQPSPQFAFFPCCSKCMHDGTTERHHISPQILKKAKNFIMYYVHKDLQKIEKHVCCFFSIAPVLDLSTRLHLNAQKLERANRRLSTAVGLGHLFSILQYNSKKFTPSSDCFFGDFMFFN
jgi:hypothetical protein